MELRNVKILLMPDAIQRKAFYDSAYYSDRIYNQAIDWNIEVYKETGKFLSKFDMFGMIPDFCKDNPDFSSVDNYVLRDAISNLRDAFDRMKKVNGGFPNYKKIGRHNSFGVRADRVHVKCKNVRIPSIGWVKCKHCHWLTRSKSDEDLAGMKWHNPHIVYDNKYWYLVVGIDVSITQDSVSDEVIGIDLGIKHTAVLSNGVVKNNINNTRQIVNLEKRKKRYQRKVSRKYELNKQGRKFVKTRNIKKLERRIKLIDRRLHNIREDYIQSLTNEIIHIYPKRIMLEDLKIKNMMKNRHLSRAIQQQLFYRIRQLLIEKARNTLSIQVGIIDSFYPSSKICNKCGCIKKGLKLSDRTYECNNCGNVDDRDLNASKNIRDCGTYKLAF